MERRILTTSEKLKKLSEQNSDGKKLQENLLDSLKQLQQMIGLDDQFSRYSPSQVERVREKIQEHIDEQCSLIRKHSEINNSILEMEMKDKSGKIDKDNVGDIEQKIKDVWFSIPDDHMDYINLQYYIDNIIEHMGILPCK
ncbi:hypothetical protein OXYTRIMIC_030 [Oxytricha trifallax]|uniref:Uncharacterized protein n=1 Tax=Oxytricha trifallax TaxID=1172189 RepID=A0A073HYL6_9SPIT|nr:hypothetical protein OXYTRIMIC_030 [Oxytricha trifallax]